MRDSFYFSHDYNSRVDPKIKKLLMKFGMEGYGVFWAIIEDLYQNNNSLPLDFEALAYEYRVSVDLIKWLVSDSGLFIIENDSFKSLSVEKRLNLRAEKQSKARQSAKIRWQSVSDANAMQSQCERTDFECESNAIKEKKSKVNINNKLLLVADENQKNQPSSLFAIWGKPNPSLAELQLLEKLICEFSFDEVKNAFYIAASQSVYKLSYVKGILNKKQNSKISALQTQKLLDSFKPLSPSERKSWSGFAQSTLKSIYLSDSSSENSSS